MSCRRWGRRSLPSGAAKSMQRSQGTRRGRNFTLRWTDAEWAQIQALRESIPGPRPMGPWLLHALRDRNGSAGPHDVEAVPGQVEDVELGHCLLERGIARPRRLILDLCAGTGSWSEPYRLAGYDVRRVTLPGGDVRTFRPPAGVHGILAAPPCNEFSILKRGPRDFATGLECVTACLRIVAEAQPTWWALENPATGLLRRWLGVPRDTWQPHHFGDPWTKLTALWGCFTLPARCHVAPISRMVGDTSAERARTPPGFARAFFLANP